MNLNGLLMDLPELDRRIRLGRPLPDEWMGSDLRVRGLDHGLSPEGHKAHEIILNVLEDNSDHREDSIPHTGGCRAFYTPKFWQLSGHEFGERSHLVVVYDGGDLASFFRLGEDEELYEEMRQALASAKLYSEECTGVHSAIYSLP